ncbi:VOC family protein [Curtobacterium sp. Leaf154]|uniref:VOC family protein n=1 Tax=Curtobacterium sp. Leaf154 TaxID=1736277 RepID=UPI0009E91E52|nr:VOC family protein [Curtobacterium sp. Leaf154]
MGGLHHVELWTDDQELDERRWDWLLTTLGWSHGDVWERGRSWALGSTYLVLTTAPLVKQGHHDRRRAGLNHLAFHAGTDAELERLVVEAPNNGWQLLYEDRYPGPNDNGSLAAYLSTETGWKVEIVVGESTARNDRDENAGRQPVGGKNHAN